MVDIDFDRAAVMHMRMAMLRMPQMVHKAQAAAINRTLTGLRTQVSKTVRKNYVISAADIKKTISLQKAKAASPSGAMLVKGKPVRLQKFKVKESKRGPMRVKVKKSQSPQPVKGLFHRGEIFMHRRQKARYPLKSPYGPSVPQMTENPAILDELAKFARTRLNERLIHEIDYRLGRV